jgi:DinB family protein
VRIESPAFTERELQAFLDEVVDHERQRTAERLEADSTRLAALVTQGLITRGDGQREWSGHDVLAHIAVLSKFYGVLIHQVGSGKRTEVDLLEQVQNRDVAGDQLSSLSPEQLLAIAQRDHQRTASYLRSADADAMQRRVGLYEGFTMSALEIAQLPLCAHLEVHLDQLERTIRP